MPNLVACPSCNSHVRVDERQCPHCGHALRDAGGRIGRTAGAVLMGLSLSACADKDDSNDETSASSMTTAEPEYGVPATEGEPDYGVPTSESSSGSESGSSSSSESGTTMIGEPEYGVAETGTTGDTDTDTDASTGSNG